MVKTVGKYDLYGTLGEGAFGKVKYAVNTETNEPVAIKILDKDKIQARNMGAQIKKEISIMKMINHHHVVSVKDVFATSAKIFIVLEFVGGGELFDKIANEGKLPEDKARFYFKQLVEGLEHCHNQGICHRDLKPENLLLDTDGNLKISDFGFSTLNIGDADGDGATRAELLHTTCGTPNYVAPEVLGKDGYDGKKADVWSCGVILYVLLAGYLPFDENTMAALFQKIKNADYEFPEWFTPDARDLISKILVPDPFKRPRLAEIKLHSWMQKGDSGPSPVTPINHAAQMGVPAERQQAIQEHQKKQEQQQQQQSTPRTAVAAAPSAKSAQAGGSSKNAPPPPISTAVDRVNEKYSTDKAAVMSTPNNAAAQANVAKNGQEAKVVNVNININAGSTGGQPAAAGSEKKAVTQAVSPPPAPVQESNKQADIQKSQAAPSSSSSVASPSAQSASVAANTTKEAPSSRPASTAASPVTNNSAAAAKVSEKQPAASPAPAAAAAKPAAAQKPAAQPQDDGIFACCTGRNVASQTKSQNRPN